MTNKCMYCGKETFTPFRPNRKKKYCDNKCQNAYEIANGLKGGAHFRIPKEELENLYLVEKWSCVRLGQRYGKGIRQISRYLHEYGIPTRPFSTKGIHPWRNDEKNKMPLPNHSWKGGRNYNGYGYIVLTGRKGEKQLLEHRYIMENHLGRKLERFEIVHHINGIKDDNRIENLMVVSRHDHDHDTRIKTLQDRIKELESKLSKINS